MGVIAVVLLLARQLGALPSVTAGASPNPTDTGVTAAIDPWGRIAARDIVRPGGNRRPRSSDHARPR